MANASASMAPTAVPSESMKRRFASWTTAAGRSSKRSPQPYSASCWARGVKLMAVSPESPSGLPHPVARRRPDPAGFAVTIHERMPSGNHALAACGLAPLQSRKRQRLAVSGPLPAGPLVAEVKCRRMKDFREDLQRLDQTRPGSVEELVAVEAVG